MYGAGLLSSVAELTHAITATEKIKKFDPDVTCCEECIITSYQNAYYYTDSFEEAKEQMRVFAEGIQRPFGVRYNPYTQSVEVLSNAQKITAVVSELRGDLSIVCSALKKISATDENLDVEKIANMLQNSLNVGIRLWILLRKLTLFSHRFAATGHLSLLVLTTRITQTSLLLNNKIFQN